MVDTPFSNHEEASRTSITEASDHAPYINLTFCPSVALISVVRRFVSSFFEEVLVDRDATSRLALTTHELLENAARCSTDGEVTLRIDAARAREDLRIRTWNRADMSQIEILRSHFAEMVGVHDPFAYYQRMMERTAKRKSGSGLGLARLLAEGEMRLSCDIDGDRVCITAATHAAQKTTGGPEPSQERST